MIGFRSFITEAKKDRPSNMQFEDTPSPESRLDTETRIAMFNSSKRGKDYGEFHAMPDRELPHQHLTINNKVLDTGWVEHDHDMKYPASTTLNITPANKKLKNLGTCRVVQSTQSQFTKSPVSHVYSHVETPEGRRFAYEHIGSYGKYHPEDGSEAISSTDLHNLLRKHEPSFFPATKTDDNFFSTEPQASGNKHTVTIGKTTPFSATKMPDWSHTHPMTQDSLTIAHHAINRVAAKYGHNPYRVKAFYDGGTGNRSAMHLSNGKHEAVMLRVKSGTGSTKTLYNKHGSSAVLEDGMTSHMKVFGTK